MARMAYSPLPKRRPAVVLLFLPKCIAPRVDYRFAADQVQGLALHIALYRPVLKFGAGSAFTEDSF